MMKQMLFSQWFVKGLVYLMAAAIVFGCVLSAILTHAIAGNDDSPAWAAPSAMTIRRVSTVAGAQSSPTFFENLDCNLVTYRMVASSNMQTGCFTETAFGLLDSDSGTMIFNGTDEALQWLPYTPHQILAPWPKALDLVALDPVDSGGTLISLYKNPLGASRDVRNTLAQLTAKQLTAPPDITLKDSSGKPLVINPQTLAFSDGGSWLVAETLGHSFVRINLATLKITAFAPAYGSQGSPGLLKSRVAVSEDGQFVAIANDDATAFKIYDLATCDGVINNLQPENCQSYDYRPFAGQQIGGLQSVRHVRFINDNLLSFDAIAGNPANSGTYELAPTGSITSLTDYIGLGDSYTSGEGAFDYLADTDSTNNMCHLSRNSYPLLLTHDLFSGSGGHSVACSGAVINDVGSTADNYRGQVRGVANLQQLQQSQPLLLESVETNFVPGYVAQQRFVKRWQPQVATVSVGGDDIGFGDLVQNCVEPHVSRHASDSTCYSTYEDRLELMQLVDRTIPRWTALYNQLRHEAPAMQLYAIGYPQIVSDTGTCALNVQLNKNELEFAASMIDYLNQDIQKAATAAHVPYVDISQALAGHRLCETASYNVAVNGLTAGTDAGPLGTEIFGKESYHPNALGQSLIEQTILKKTHNLAATISDSADSSDTGPKLLNAPKSGRTINTIVPDDTLTAGTGKRSGSILVQANGNTDGLQPGTAYTVHIDGINGTPVGTLTSDAEGNISGEVSIPSGTIPGAHTIDVTGQNQDGEPVDVTQPIYIVSSDADSDGDGIDDMTDSCPGAINSGQDSDQDGVDDICDSMAGPSAGSGSSGSQTRSGGGAQPDTSGNYSVSGIVTIAAQLSVSHAAPIITHDIKTAAISNSSAVRILGAATVKPYTLSSHRLGPGMKTSQAKKTGNPDRLRIIYWLLWCISVIAIWAILIVGMCISKGQGLDYNEFMLWFRKGFVYFLSLVLLVCLIGTALATSANQTLGKPKKVETLLNQSQLYEHFVANATSQAKKSAGDDQSGSVSLSDSAVQTAAQSAFPSSLIQQSINTFIDSNYAWLKGKTATPNFSIDLSSQKQTFAEKVGQYVKTYTAGLPVCTDAALAQQQGTDPLAASCRPSFLTPEAAGAQVTADLSTSGDFLSNPVVTASSLNPKANQQSKPYYEKLSGLPKVYRLGTKLPLILGVVSIVSALAIIAIAPVRRKGTRVVGVMLVLAGIILVVLKFAADFAFKKAENRIFNSSSIGQLQHSLTDFAHRVESSMVKTDLIFGIVFLILGVIILSVLLKTRTRTRPKSANIKDFGKTAPQPTAGQPPIAISRAPRNHLGSENMAPDARPKRPPRLIQ